MDSTQVFYEIMSSDATKYHKPELAQKYAEAKSALNTIDIHALDYKGQSTGDLLISMAQNEADKEMQLLNNIFGCPLNIQLKTAQDCRALTNAINSVFHFKSVLDRNKSMITSPEFAKGTKAVFSYFGSYFSKVITRHTQEIIDGAKQGLLNGQNSGQAAINTLKGLMPTMVLEATEEMFTQANTEVTSNQRYQQAYKEIFLAIQQDFINTGDNIFLQRVREIYGLDTLVNNFQTIINELSQNNSKNVVSKAVRKLQSDFNKSAKYSSKGGFTLEGLVDQVLGMVVGELNGVQANGVTIRANHYKGWGKLNTRPDNIITFNVPASVVNQAEQEIQQSRSKWEQTRLTDSASITKLSDNISNIKNGFIVYISDKNYDIGSGQGHQGAENVPLKQLPSILSNGPIHDIDQIIYNIAQYGTGAIGAGNDYGAEDAIAANVAYFLFDDYHTIGQKSQSGQSIHIMNLEGMMVPLSTFLFALGSAINAVSKDVSSIAHVHIVAPSIKYGEGVKDARGGGARFYPDNWDKQQQDVLNNTRININFLLNMQDFTRRYV